MSIVGIQNQLGFHRGESRISGKGVHMYKGVGFALVIVSHFLKYPVEMKLFCLTETKLFHFHRIFKVDEGFKRTHSGSATDSNCNIVSNSSLTI